MASSTVVATCRQDVYVHCRQTYNVNRVVELTR